MYKNIFSKKDTALFDLDGTLVETKPIALRALQETLVDNELSFIEGKNYFITGGREWKDIWKAIKIAEAPETESSIEELATQTHNRYMELLSEVTLDVKEGFLDFFYELKEEKGYKTGLTTNSEKGVAELIMNKLEINGIFDFCIFGDQVKKKKPNPQMYKKALKALRSSPSKTIVFEDSLIGSKAANKAGLDIIIVWNKEVPKYLFPKRTKLYIHNFSELIGTLDETKFESLQRRVKKQPEENQ